MSKGEKRIITIGEYKTSLLYVITLLIVLPIIYRVFPNVVTSSLLFFGYLLIISILSIFLIVWCVTSVSSQDK